MPRTKRPSADGSKYTPPSSSFRTPSRHPLIVDISTPNPVPTLACAPWPSCMWCKYEDLRAAPLRSKRLPTTCYHRGGWLELLPDRTWRQQKVKHSCSKEPVQLESRWLGLSTSGRKWPECHYHPAPGGVQDICRLPPIPTHRHVPKSAAGEPVPTISLSPTDVSAPLQFGIPWYTCVRGT